MEIQLLWFKNFRIYDDIQIEMNPHFNFFIGNNGTGKTTLLEGISCLLGGKSFLHSKDNVLIKKNASGYYLASRISSSFQVARIENIYEQSHKHREIKLNNKKIHSFKELLTRFPFVTFSSEDLEMIEKGPELRRKFFDRLISYIELKYYENLVTYSKILKQRNELLKIKDKSNLDFWDRELVKFAQLIQETRKNYLEEFNQFCLSFGHFPNGADGIHFVYLPSPRKELFEEVLKKNREKDMKLGYTTAGPHRDEYSIEYNLGLFKDYASQGQMKSMAFFFKIFQAIFIQKKTRIKPALLIDDIFAELDFLNRKKIIESLKNLGFQSFISSTSEEFIKDFLNNTSYNIFEISEGRAVKK